MKPLVILVLVVAASVAATYGHAAHDAAAARRFRGLTSKVVNDPLDKVWNKRWHTAGFWLRAAIEFLIGACAGLYLRSWDAFACGFATAGFLSSALFDPLFAVKFGLSWDYVGNTSSADAMLTAKLTGLIENKAAAALLVEVLLAIVAAVLFLVLTR